jgi:hypothetical protein
MGSSSGVGWPVGAIKDIGQAILHTLAYADLFDYPLTTEELHRYLIAYRTSLSAVKAYLDLGRGRPPWVARVSSFWCLAGREALADLRQERQVYAQSLYREVERYTPLIAALPFVRSVALTGSLTMHNVTGPDDDIDLLIVAAPGRVWLARGLVILIVHLAQRFGVELCPNYVLAEHRLQLGEPSLYIAHELAQLMPLYGFGAYQRLMQGNAWVAEYLPNATARTSAARHAGAIARGGQKLMEASLAGRLGDGLEGWERERKIPKLRRVAIERGGTGTTYSADLCKGHVDDHASTVQGRYMAQLSALGL